MADNKIIKKIVLSDGTAADLDVKYWGGLETSAKQDTLISGNNIKTINGQSIVGKGNINIDTIGGIQAVTYEQLNSLIKQDMLMTGYQYRITDYVTTTTQENTISAGHKFDIIVTALDESTLSEEAKAIQNDNDDYFDSCNLSAWKIWYSLDNDINRFKWASPYLLSVGYHYDSSENLHELDTWIQAIAKVCDDSIDDFYESIDDGLDETFSHFGYTNYNGITQLTLYGRTLEDELDYRHNYHYKGIITIDGVEYDSWAQLYYNDNGSTSYATNGSGNIYILLTNRIVAENGKGVIYRMIDEWGNDCPYDFKNIQFKRWLYADGAGVADEDSGDFYSYCYTFSWEDRENGIMDASIFGNNGYLLNDEGQIDGVYGNIIGVYNSYDGYDESPESTKQYLNDIVFFSTYGYDGVIYYGCYSNTFGNDCYSNTFGNDCSSNTFGNVCSSNTFGNDCSSNTFGNYCYSNTFGNACYSNTFGNNCVSNTFGNYCHSNTFGNDCYSNTFGNDCYSNTFGNDCYGNVLPNNCLYNTFDTACSKNTIINEAGTTQKYNIKKGVSEKTIIVDSTFINLEIGVDVWVTSSGELIQEPINEYISLEDIDLMWGDVFSSELYYSGTSQDSEEIINSIGIGDYDEEKEGSDEE